MEFGPRALGARSILGDARNPTMQATMNLKIKFRESFRPFAPCVLQERGGGLFRRAARRRKPLHAARGAAVGKTSANLSEPEQKKMVQDPDLRQRVNIVRSALPAITHVDYSARLQTVDEPRNGRFLPPGEGIRAADRFVRSS